jgi:hypothetical protein
MKKNKYQIRKEEIKQEAIEWQNNFESNNYSWGELAEIQANFEKKAKKYGLSKEFKENGII